MRRRMKELRLQGIATRLNYSSDDVDEEWEMEAPPRFQTQPLKEMEGQTMQGIPPLLAAHLSKTERRNRTMSPREALIAHRIPTHGAYHPNQQLYTIKELHEDQRIAGFVYGVKLKSVVKFISTELPKSYDELMEKTYSWLQAGETTSEGKIINFMDSSTRDKTQKGRPWEGSRKKNKDKRDRFSLYKEPNLRILQSLAKSPREILVTKKVGKIFMKPPKMVSNTRDTSKYCEFHQDYGYDTNACIELKHQIEEVVKSGKLAHLIKRIRKGRAKQTYYNAPLRKEDVMS
uniref:Reverse transcriptase domain-containing protein n=1 Tax=Tanacetum cinerariifolium TaxID=118510 RepID=A0A6L2NPS4_TANCI|nr:hypothetical protein [Tanacetum cinerariifolium]